MKKVLILVASLCICGAALAQPSKGDVILKGSIGYNTAGVPPHNPDPQFSTATSSYAANLWSISPKLEYFLTDRSSIGLSGSYMNAWLKDKYSSVLGKTNAKRGVEMFYVGPTYNYYIKLAERFYLSINCFIGYAGVSSWDLFKEESEFYNLDERHKECVGFGLLTVTPTLNYFINDRWLLTASVGSLAGAYGKLPNDGNNIYYAGANWGNIMLGVGFKF